MNKQHSQQAVSRRQFLAVSTCSSAAVIAGCAINPVTGRRQYMLVSEAMEVNLDRKWAPHQFSTDYGPVQDPKLNTYINQVGMEIAALSHRPHMPYNFRAVNSVVVNGYTLPAGSVALARGLMLSFNDESEMASVLGHEIGHVSRRHAGERMSKGLTTQLVITALSSYMQEEYEQYAALAAGLGAVGANLLLSRYSRDDEREADGHGMEYPARAGINPKGMIGVMKTFKDLRKSKPNVVELLFSTHPMSDERYNTAVRRLDAEYKDAISMPTNRDRFMDNTAKLRALRGPIEDMQKGQELMMQQKYNPAETLFASALKKAPNDYAGLLMMSKCCLAQNRHDKANRYAELAKAAYPEEAQARHVSGMAKLSQSKYESALAEFQSYEKILPGNNNTIFFKGLCLDKMGRRRDAAQEYARYRNAAPSGEFAGPVTNRLTQWGYIQPQQPKPK